MRDSKPRSNMSMVFTVWHNGVYGIMAGIEGTGSSDVAGSSVIQMVACGKTTSFTFSYQLVQISNILLRQTKNKAQLIH